MMRMLLLMVVLAAVWYLWKTITEQKAAVEADEAADAAKAEAEADPTTPRPEEVAETAECPQCRAYVSIHAEGGCGREDCPIPELAAAAADADAPGEGQAPPAGEAPSSGEADKPKA